MRILKNVCAYCRVSTDSKDQANSLENQELYFRDKLDEKGGYKLVDIYADQGLSGTKLNNRPNFNKMLIDAGIDIIVHNPTGDRRNKNKTVAYNIADREPLFDEVWIKITSRFARNTLSYDIITKLRDKGVNVFFVEQGINTDDIGQDLLLKLMQLFDEQDSKDKSIKVRTGKKVNAEKGMIMANKKLYGYEFIQKENRLKIIPKEAEVVKTIFDLYSKGYGFRRISNHLKEEKMDTRGGKKWGNTSLSRLLSNAKYIGLSVRNRVTRGEVLSNNRSSRIRPEEEWIVKETDKIPAIVTREIFEKCKELRETSVNRAYNVGEYRGVTLFAGLIFCGKCGAVYVSKGPSLSKKASLTKKEMLSKGVAVPKEAVVYACKTKRYHGTKVCNSMNVKEDRLEKYITSAVYMEHVFWTKKRYVTLLEDVILRLREDRENNNNLLEIKETKFKIANVTSKIDNLIDLASQGIAKDRINIKLNELERERQDLINKNKALSKTSEDIDIEIEEVENIIKTIKELETKDEYSKEEVIDAIDKIVISDVDGKLVIHTYYKLVSKINEYLGKYGTNQQDLSKEKEEIDLHMNVFNSMSALKGILGVKDK
jgi:site-specific DNA recombinase